MELPGKVHQETSKSSKAENSLIKQSADGHSQGDSQPRDETDVRRQSTHGWEGGWEYFGRGWGKFEADYGEDPRSKPSAKDTTEPSTTTNMAWKNEAGPEQATGSESSLLPVEAQTLGASVPSSSPIASQSEAENSLIKQSADGLDSSEGNGGSSAVKVPEDQDDREIAEPEKANVKEVETVEVEGQVPKTGDDVATGDETDVRQSTHDWWDAEEGWPELNPGDFQLSPGSEQATGSESSLLPVEAQTLGASVPSSSPIASQSEVEAFCAHLTRLWPEVSATDAFVHFAGRGSDTLFAGTFTSVANSVGLPVDIFPVLSGDKSYVHLEDWLGFLEGAVQMVPEAPAHQREEEFEQRVRDLLENLEEEEDTSTESTGAANQGSEDEPSSPEEVSVQDDHSLTQRNDLQALVQELQVRLEKSEEEKIRWQREAHRQEEAATELREEMMRLMQDMKYKRIPYDKLEVGQKYHGTVKSVLDFGAIVDIGAQSHGLLHISCICKEWFNGVVARIVPFGAFVTVTLEDGATADGLVHVSKIKDGFVDKVQRYVSTGQDVQVRIESVDLDSNKMNLSMRAYAPSRR
ncbi:unnamed protein product [Cladocopium goreaui]|uniref:30S ribosomal protein S1 n=1 Tax=Cladocopium goreaui TaxID=2562237 RepID=A0A9P1M574_9DINO|nr:unnamed protein product [Cladocopium goreaui]